MDKVGTELKDSYLATIHRTLIKTARQRFFCFRDPRSSDWEAGYWGAHGRSSPTANSPVNSGKLSGMALPGVESCCQLGQY